MSPPWHRKPGTMRCSATPRRCSCGAPFLRETAPHSPAKHAAPGGATGGAGPELANVGRRRSVQEPRRSGAGVALVLTRPNPTQLTCAQLSKVVSSPRHSVAVKPDG
eukprot:scaffold114975_cov87-Phaeocystis_antarctica.AAC.1